MTATSPLTSTLTATEAARALGVQRRTLYAYVSRGLLSSVPNPARPRERRYPAAAVRRLQALSAARRDPNASVRAAARAALRWGEPVLDSAITQITSERVSYRGHDAVSLAECNTPFEAVAELLWTGAPLARTRRPALEEEVDRALARALVRSALTALAAPDALDARTHSASALHLPAGVVVAPIRAAAVAFAVAAATDSWETTGAALMSGRVAAQRFGRRVLAILSEIACDAGQGNDASGIDAPGVDPVAGRSDVSAAVPRGAQSLDSRLRDESCIAGRLARVWAPMVAGASTVYNAALVLLADHDLSAATFAARVVASTGGSPYAALGAGLATLAGPGQGGDTEKIAALLNRAADISADDALVTESTLSGSRSRDPSHHAPNALDAYVAKLRRRGERIPGFGHRLYPAGDPRARTLLAIARTCLIDTGLNHGHVAPPVGAAPHTPGFRPDAILIAERLAAAVERETGELPTVDFALVTIARATSAPAHAPLTLFALGRSAGLVAHIIEQSHDPRVLRPHARYVGPSTPHA